MPVPSSQPCPPPNENRHWRLNYYRSIWQRSDSPSKLATRKQVAVSETRRNQKRARAILLLQDGRPDALQAFCNTLPDTGRAEQKDALQFFESTSLPDLMITLQEVQTLPDMDYLFARQFLEEWALGRWIQTLNEEHGIVPSSATM